MFLFFLFLFSVFFWFPFFLFLMSWLSAPPRSHVLLEASPETHVAAGFVGPLFNHKVKVTP